MLDCQACQLSHILLVKAADDHHIQFDRTQAGPLSGKDPFPYIFQVIEAGQLLELERVEGVSMLMLTRSKAGFGQRS